VAFNTLAAAADSMTNSSYQLSSMSSGISCAASWAAAVSPDPSLHQHLPDFAGVYDACGPAHAAAPAAAANPFMLPVHDWTASAQDVESLELMLESELTAAALHAHLTAFGSGPLDAESQRVSQQLAAAVVEHSGLFETTPVPSKPQEAPVRPDPFFCSQQLCSVSVSSSSAAAAGPCHGSAMMCSDPMTASCHPSAYWSPEGHGINLAAVQGTAGYRAPAYTAAAASAASCAGPQVSMPFRSTFPPVAPCAPVAPPAASGASRQELAAAAAGVLTGQAERLEQLKQQMFHLQARVDQLKRQLCM